MLRISERTFTSLGIATLTAARILERTDLQEYICNSSDAFFAELNEDFFLLGKEVQPSVTVQDRMDVLAVDKNGQLVVVEIKRGNDKFQLLQAISYAAMLSTWSADDILRLAGQKADALIDFLEIDEQELNSGQRILLLAEAYDFEVLASAEWLFQQYGVQITCARLHLAIDSESATEYLTCSQIFPTPELSEQAKPRSGRLRPPIENIRGWSETLAGVRNEAVLDFFNRHIAGGCEARVGRSLFFCVAGKRRVWLGLRQAHSYLWQMGRFEGDIEFWQSRLSDASSVEGKNYGTALSAHLRTSEDIIAFEAALSQLPASNWNERPALLAQTATVCG